MKSKAFKNIQKQRTDEKSKVLVHSDYKITYERIENEEIKKLPSNIRRQIEQSFSIIFSDTTRAISILTGLKKKYPNVSVLYNYLYGAYTKLGEFEKAETIAIENYKKHPDNLFAKINYAQLCLHKNEIEKIPEIFQNKFDLKTLYPHRSEFHISEFVGFTYISCIYFLKMGSSETAELGYKMLKLLAPRHPMTKEIKKLLYPSFISRLLGFNILIGILSFLSFTLPI